MRTTFSALPLLLAFATAGLAACSSASSTEAKPGPTSDASTPEDSASPKSDSATPKSDSAAPKSDSAAPKSDSATPTTDGGLPPGVKLDRSSAPRDKAVAASIATAVDANNAFALDLYGKVVPTFNGGNGLTSPISASLALTMTYAGAQGTTATQMASVLHIPTSGTSIFDGQNALSQALDGRAGAAYDADKQSASQGGGKAPSPSDYVLTVVNSVWGQTGDPWAGPFLDVLAKSYGTGVYLLDIDADPTAAETDINDWVSNETGGKINPLLGPNVLDSSTQMVLVNAIHVKLPWYSAFNTIATAPRTFTRGDKSTVTAQFMNQTFDPDQSIPYGYAATTAGQFLSLPLAGNQLSVVFALPTQDLPTLTASLTKDSFKVPSTSSTVILALPKFSFTGGTISLKSALQSLGMTEPFQGDADFNGMVTTPLPDGLFISDVFQKAMMDVAENGVEAAAATAVVMATGAAAPEDAAPPIILTFDQPFVVSIVDSSGAILFLGQIDDPTASGS
jgi:serpin B